MSERLTEWAMGRPPASGYWDTKLQSYFYERAFEVRMWWDGSFWKTSPHSNNTQVRQSRFWRGLAQDPATVGAQVSPPALNTDGGI